jgi:hypothetical protein
MSLDAMLTNALSNSPNFIGFILLSLMLYRALMASMANNRDLADKMIQCYRDRVDLGISKSE